MEHKGRSLDEWYRTINNLYLEPELLSPSEVAPRASCQDRRWPEPSRQREDKGRCQARGMGEVPCGVSRLSEVTSQQHALSQSETRAQEPGLGIFARNGRED